MGVGGTPVTPVSSVGVAFPAGTAADPITVTVGGDTGGDATAANQAIQITAEQAILAKLTSDPATQTTLAAVLAKIIAAPATAANQATEITSLASIDTKVGSATPAGANVIGKVGIDQTTPGTSNLVAAGQSGAWNIVNVSGTVTLPTGASTAAKQPALGTAGAASADILTVQGFEASNVAVTSAPFGMGGLSSSSYPTSVITGRRVNTWHSLRGAPVISFGAVTSAVDANSNGLQAYILDSTGDSLSFLPIFNFVYNGASWDRQRGNTSGTFVLPGGHSFANITTATTTTVKSGAGVLHTLTVNNLGTVASTTTVYDNTAGSGTKIATINTLAGQTSYIYDVAFATGLTIVTTGTVAPDITVSYR